MRFYNTADNDCHPIVLMDRIFLRFSNIKLVLLPKVFPKATAPSSSVLDSLILSPSKVDLRLCKDDVKAHHPAVVIEGQELMSSIFNFVLFANAFPSVVATSLLMLMVPLR